MSEVEAQVATATVKLHIDNAYELYEDVVTTPTVVVPLPIPVEGSDERDEWEQEHIFSATGAGHEDGDSWYDVEIVESTVPELVGMTFEFGY